MGDQFNEGTSFEYREFAAMYSLCHGQHRIHDLCLSGIGGRQHSHCRTLQTTVPGTEVGVVFGKFGLGSGGYDFAFNNRGQVAFYASLVGRTVTATSQLGVWTEGRGGLQLVARGGDPSPGLPAGTKFSGSNLSYVQLNNAGVTAIGQHNPAFWTDNGTSSLQLIAQSHASVPGIPNAVFDDFPEHSVLNDLGQVTIPAAIDSNLGLVVYDRADGSHHILFQTVGGQSPGLPDEFSLIHRGRRVSSPGNKFRSILCCRRPGRRRQRILG